MATDLRPEIWGMDDEEGLDDDEHHDDEHYEDASCAESELTLVIK